MHIAQIHVCGKPMKNYIELIYSYPSYTHKTSRGVLALLRPGALPYHSQGSSRDYRWQAPHGREHPL